MSKATSPEGTQEPLASATQIQNMIRAFNAKHHTGPTSERKS
jgi:hypothetical protein